MITLYFIFLVTVSVLGICFAAIAGFVQFRAQSILMATIELESRILTAQIALGCGDCRPAEKLIAEKPEWDRRLSMWGMTK